MNPDITFSQIDLRESRKAAKRMGVKIPKRMTALKCSIGKCYLVEADGFRKEVRAQNAFDAKARVINTMVINTMIDQAIETAEQPV